MSRPETATSTQPPPYPLWQRALAEGLGTALLLCAVVGSGIMAQRLAGGNPGLALLANTLATVFALYALIETLGPVSGAHLNPLVSLSMGRKLAQPGEKYTWIAIVFIASQLLGAVAGTGLAHAMFELPLLQASNTLRGGWGQWTAEAVATATLLLAVHRSPAGKASSVVASTIGAAYWFTASTSFANPAAVLGRMLSDSFAGIAPASAWGFVGAQGVGAVVGMGAVKLLSKR